jgi:hypothetical protein
MNISKHAMSKHAEQMSQVRGITMKMVELHEKFADREAFVGGGRSSYTVSPKGVEAMIRSGISVQVADKVQRIAIVYGGTGTVVTLLRMLDGKAKNYTRGARKRSRGRSLRNSKESLRRRRRG